MSYEKNTWETGDVITAAKLNNMEDGIAESGGVLVIHESQDGAEYTLDKTWQEIYDAFSNCRCLLSPSGNGGLATLKGVRVEDEGSSNVYYVEAINGDQWTCTSPDEYPSYYAD